RRGLRRRHAAAAGRARRRAVAAGAGRGGRAGRAGRRRRGRRRARAARGRPRRRPPLGACPVSARPVGAAGGAPTTRARASRGGRGVLLRRVTARAGLLVRRRARRDLGLLAATTALVALAALLAVAGPRIVATTLDDATVQTVRGLGG